MKEFFKTFSKGIVFGLGIIFVLGISYIFIKARSETKSTTDTEPNKLYAGAGDTLSATKRNSMIDKINKDFPQETLNAGQAGTEQDTGIKWIDGKKIYCKVVNFGPGTNGTDKYIAHGISNLSNIIEYKAIIGNGSTQWENIGGTRTNNLIFRIEGGNIHMRSSAGTNFSAQNSIVIIYYTKTS